MQYKKQDINEKILQAGREEYFKNGYRAGNISTIAQAAGVPVGNLYRYFDGKSGLLDAIVKPAYLQVPRVITELASVENVSEMSLEQIMPNLIDGLIGLFDTYGKEILILVDKCATTRYDDFAENITKQVAGLIHLKLYGAEDKDESNFILSGLIAKAFINSVFDVLRMELPRDNMTKVMEKILQLYFFEVNKRK